MDVTLIEFTTHTEDTPQHNTVVHSPHTLRQTEAASYAALTDCWCTLLHTSCTQQNKATAWHTSYPAHYFCFLGRPTGRLAAVGLVTPPLALCFLGRPLFLPLAVEVP
ncbi:TPA: hypothetical protein ACH3X1_004292 [Trebouxia sp. C0004]